MVNMAVEGRRNKRFLLLSAATVAAALVLVAAIAILLSHLESISTSSPVSGTSVTSTTSSSSTMTTKQVTETIGSSFESHMLSLASRNVSAIISHYEGNTSIIWTGVASGLAGTYIGANNTSILLNNLIGRANSFAVGNLTRTVVATSDDSATVNSTFDFLGRSTLYGNFSGSISAQDLFVYSAASGAWLISHEVWNFLSFNYQPPPPFGYALSGNQTVDALSVSTDGNYVAAGASDTGGYNGSVFLVSLQNGAERVLWRHVTNGTTIGSVAISSDGSYVVAAGCTLQSRGIGCIHTELFVFNRGGDLLWNFSPTGSVLGYVAISANGSRIAATYGNIEGRCGITYFNNAGDVLWNYTSPQGGSIHHLSMSSSGRSIAYGQDGVFYLNSRGAQVWNYTVGNPDVNFIQMSSDGSFVAAGTIVTAYNGSVLYFDGRTGALLWDRQAHTEVQPLVMSADGSHIAIGGNTGVMLLDSSGNILWNYSLTSVAGPPISVLQSGSLVLLSGSYAAEPITTQLIGYNGTIAAAFDIPATSAVAASLNGPVWVVVEGLITSNGGCATLHLFDGSTALPSMQLCSSR